jgi:hypothetical protein
MTRYDKEGLAMRRQLILGIAGIIALGLLSSVPAAAEVNCKFVLKNLSIGRTVEQVAETMMISEDEIKKCQEEAAAKKKAEGGAEKKADSGH